MRPSDRGHLLRAGAALGRLALAAMLGGCLSVRPGAPVHAPDLDPPAGQPVTAAGRLYAACVGEATSSGRVDVVGDRSTHLLRFTCTGTPARSLYEALGDWSRSRRSTWEAGGRTWRSTEAIERDLVGADYCSSSPAGGAECSIQLNVGPFLLEAPRPARP